MKEKLASLVQDPTPPPPLNLNDSLTNKDTMGDDRKSLKVSHSFIKRQNSSKKMVNKNKITKIDDPPPPPVSALPLTGPGQIHKREHSASAVRSASRKEVNTESISTITSTNSEVKLPPLSAINENKHQVDPEKPITSTTPRNPETSSIRLPRLSLSTKAQNHDADTSFSFPNVISSKTLPLTARFDKVHHQSTIGPSPPHKALQRTATVSCPTSSPKWNDINNENIIPNYSSNPPSNPPPAPPGLSDSKEAKEMKESKEKELKELKDVDQTPTGSKMSLNEVLQKLNHLEMRVNVKEKFVDTEQTDLKRQMEDMKSSLDNLVSVINHMSTKFVVT